MPSIIKIENLTKRFTDTLAVDSISFEVQQGDLFAFLGTNGAGKSTTINMICTLLEKTSGKVFVDGLDLDKNAPEIRNEIGIVFQENVLDFPLTVEDNLYTRGRFSGLSGKALKARVQELRKLMQLEDTWKRPYGKLSGGQKRKCEIARALISTPKLLILDEPTTGLDPQTRKSIWETIRTLQSKNEMTVFLTTHYMEEAAAADYVVILEKGKICADGTPAALKNKYCKDMLRLRFSDLENGKNQLSALGLQAQQKTDTLCLSVENSHDALKIMNSLHDFIDFELIKGTMDDVFLNVTGHKEVDAQ